MAVNQLAIVVGILSTYISNWLLVGTSENDWRWMFEVEAIPAGLFTLALFMIPESPRWLAKKGRFNEAHKVFSRIAGNDYADAEMTIVKSSLKQEEGGFAELLNPKIRIVLVVGFFIAFFSNACGINIVIYYGNRIFQQAGFVAEESSFKAQVIIGLTNLIFTFVGMALIDRLGRKILLTSQSLGILDFNSLQNKHHIILDSQPVLPIFFPLAG